jgi:hypothetical protein
MVTFSVPGFRQRHGCLKTAVGSFAGKPPGKNFKAFCRRQVLLNVIDYPTFAEGDKCYHPGVQWQLVLLQIKN